MVEQKQLAKTQCNHTRVIINVKTTCFYNHNAMFAQSMTVHMDVYSRFWIFNGSSLALLCQVCMLCNFRLLESYA